MSATSVDKTSFKEILKIRNGTAGEREMNRPQLFRVLPSLRECVNNSVGMREKCFLYHWTITQGETGKSIAPSICQSRASSTFLSSKRSAGFGAFFLTCCSTPLTILVTIRIAVSC